MTFSCQMSAQSILVKNTAGPRFRTLPSILFLHKFLVLRQKVFGQLFSKLSLQEFQFQEIGKRIMKGATDKGAEVAYHAAVDRLAAQLVEDGSCHIVDMHLKNLEQAENKNAAATYRYRVDCDGEWGEIHFDFENKKIKIQRLADWDTTRSHRYAWKVIGVVARNGNKVLPEKKRLIFWAGDIGQKKKRVLLQPLEMVCSESKHPLSSVSGRRRYNTLDFPTENRVPTGRFHPYWKPRIKGICYPFEIPARLYICTHKQRKRVCEYRSINAKIPRDFLRQGEKFSGFLICRIHQNGRTSCVIYADTDNLRKFICPRIFFSAKRGCLSILVLRVEKQIKKLKKFKFLLCPGVFRGVLSYLNRSTFQLSAGILTVAFWFSTVPPGPAQGATFIGFSSVLIAFTSS